MGRLLVQVGADDMAELLVRHRAGVVLVEGAEELPHLVRVGVGVRVGVRVRVRVTGFGFGFWLGLGLGRG